MRHEDLKGIHEKLDQILDKQHEHHEHGSVHSGDVSPTIELSFQRHTDAIVAKLEPRFKGLEDLIKEARTDAKSDQREMMSNILKVAGLMAVVIVGILKLWH